MVFEDAKMHAYFLLPQREIYELFLKDLRFKNIISITVENTISKTKLLEWKTNDNQ